MCKKETIAVVLGLLLLIFSGCSDSSVNEDTTTQNNNTTIESKSTENTTGDEDVLTDNYDLMMNYVEQIQSDFTREQVVAIMGEPDLLEGSGIVRNYYNFDEYKVCIIYALDGLLLDIINNTTGERTSVY